MDVSIIIVTYNTLNLTSECIKSIIKHTTDIEYEIILVDNNSKDGSYEYFSEDKRIKYIFSAENLGFGRANNLGVKSATGKYLFFLNSDTLLISNAILDFYESMENNPDIAAMGGQLLWPDHSKQESFFSFPTLRLILKDCLGLINHHPEQVGANDSIILLKNKSISGADLIMSRSLFVKIGGFCPDFFMYYEETDLQYRIVKHNLNLAFNPNINIIHYNGGSQIDKNPNKSEIKRKYCRKIAIFNRSRIIYFIRNQPNKTFLLRCILTVGVLLRSYRIYGHFFELLKNIWNTN